MGDCVLQEEEARRQILAHKQLLRSELNQLRNETKQRKVDNRAEQHRWQNKLQADANAFFQEQADKRGVEREARVRLDRERAEAYEVTKRVRQAAKERDEELERQMHLRSIEARRIEVAKDEEKKKRHQAQLKSLQVERAQASETKREQKRVEAIQDVEIMRQQQDLMDRQAREREGKLEKIRENQNKKMAAYEAAAGNALQEAQRKDEARMKQAEAARLQQESQAQQDKQDRKNKSMLDCKAAMRVQLEEKKQLRAKEQEESMRLANQLKRDAQINADEEKRKVEERRQKAKEHANFLLSQMQEKSVQPGRFGHEQMTDVEKAMNKDRLDRASNSESLQLLLRSKEMQFRMAGK